MVNPKSYNSWLLSPIHKAERQVSLYMEERIKHLGVSTSEGHLLSYIARYGPCAVRELLRVLGIRPTTMTSMLDRMEERGFVNRHVNPDDRRSFVVAITDSGRDVVTRCGEILEDFEKRVRRLVTREATEGLQEILSAIDEVTQIEVRSEPSKKKPQPRRNR